MYSVLRHCFLPVLILISLSVAAQDKMTPAQYIERYKALAVTEMHRVGIPASITIAQGLLESSNGNSRLAREGNNHFGIKCKKGWTGKTIIEDDDEEGECFRAYDSAYLSYIDHSEFLMGNPRYAFLFEYPRTDYHNWAHGLKKAGYATNPKYPELLLGIIQRHELHKLDHLTLDDIRKSGEPVPVIPPVAEEKTPEMDFTMNKIPATRAGAGENVVSVAKKHQMGAWQIRKYNDLPKDYQLTPGEVIYLKPKKRKGSAPYHVVQPGETMWSISQKYGIKLKHLYKKNGLNRKEGDQPRPGDSLFLQSKNPTNLQPSGKEVAPEAEPKVIVPPVKETPAKQEKSPKEEPGKAEEPLPVITKDPVLTPQEVKDTIAIPREKTDVSQKVTIHVVKAGETLFAISRLYQVSVEQIRELNNLSDYSLKEGQELIINGNLKEKEPDVRKTSYVHVVKQGETLFSISRLYNISVADLRQLNNLTSDALQIGQKLLLSKADKGGAGEKDAGEKPDTHVVGKGDTLYSIAREYQITVEELKKRNGLVDNQLKIGQILKLR